MHFEILNNSMADIAITVSCMNFIQYGAITVMARFSTMQKL